MTSEIIKPKFPVPATRSQITKQWLKSVLASAFPEASFDSLQSQKIGEAYGFASEIFRYWWQDAGIDQSVVIKLWGIDSKAGLKEALFYQNFKNVGIRIPACYHCGVDEKARTSVLVLEDIRDDAIQGDVLVPLSLEQANNVARSLARLQAAWLENPELDSHSWIPEASTLSRTKDWIDNRRTLFLERFPNHLKGVARLLLDKLEPALEAANECLANTPMTLVHGDFHLDNILFERQTEPVLLDWSRPLRGPLTINLASLLFGMIPLEQFDAVFEYYLDEFNQIADIPLDKGTIEKRLGGELIRGFASSTCGIAQWEPSLPRAIEMIEVGIEHENRLVAFWQKRDSELFSFLNPSNKG